MPWKESTAMEEKQSFIMEWLSGETTMVELCRSFGISRTLGYKYIGRYLMRGSEGLEELPRAPKHVWNKTPSCVERLILDLKRSRPRYGALTIHGFLERSIDRRAVPAVSTIELMLKRHGLVKKRRRVRRIREVHPKFHAEKPNEIWSADFKGEFRMGDMRYCYPLTIMDSFSRYVLAIVGMHSPTFEGTKAVFEALFEEYGLPKQIHTDNGEPFASAVSLSRLTRLAVWFIELGIIPVYSDPAHPEQNGSHERMHKDLKAEATRAPAASLGWQQHKFTAFQREHNEVKPHQSLGQDTPQEQYYRSAKKYEGKIEPWQYPEGTVVKYVCRNGAIRWGRGKWITVSSTLIEKYIGLEQIAEGKWRVYYRNVLLGYLDEKEMRILDDQGRFRRNKKKV
jgi:transposase InsO family protein